MDTTIVALGDTVQMQTSTDPTWFSFSNVGSLASVIGLLLSVYIFLTARKINKYILITKRLPQLLRKIEIHSSSISSLLNSFDQSTSVIREELIRCSANLKSLRKKVARGERKPITSLMQAIDSSVNKEPLSKDAVRDIYLKLQYVKEAVKNLQQDLESER